MCGIAGIIHYGISDGVPEPVLQDMNDALSHRGPDGEGIWLSDDRRVGLAHRRLSIVDLTAEANQPMRNEDGSVWITFNGEIYNHLELRRELVAAGHTFATDHADTEVLIHGYEEWGIERLLGRLQGMFAFAIWDENAKRVTLARDRVGIKPAYFTKAGGRFLFASEIKSLVRHPAVTPELSETALYHYLSYLTPPAPLTMFRESTNCRQPTILRWPMGEPCGRSGIGMPYQAAGVTAGRIMKPASSIGWNDRWSAG